MKLRAGVFLKDKIDTSLARCTKKKRKDSNNVNYK